MERTTNKVVKPIVFTESNSKAEGMAPTAGNNESQFDVLIGKSKAICRSIRQWYERPSEAYSTIVGQEITPRSILRVNVLTLLIAVLCLCASRELVVTGVTTACVGWIVYHAKGEMPRQGKGGRA